MKKPKEKVTIDISINIINIDNDRSLESLSNPQDIHMNNLTPKEQEKLARKIAEALDDLDALPYHLKLVRRHPEEVLLGELEYVLSRPKKHITTSRAAYYNYLISLYERTGRYHSRA